MGANTGQKGEGHGPSPLANMFLPREKQFKPSPNSSPYVDLSDAAVASLLPSGEIVEASSIEEEVLETARTIIKGQRQDDYGTPERSFERIARLWDAYLADKLGDNTLDAHDVGIMMVLLKVARTMHSTKLDNYIDMAGYAALAAGVPDAV